jgi:hypothetical protein
MKKIAIILLGLVMLSLSNKSLAKTNSSPLVNQLQHNANALATLSLNSDSLVYDISYGWSGNTLSMYFVQATSLTNYSLVTGTSNTIYVNVSITEGGYTSTFTDYPIQFTNGSISATFNGTISNVSITLVPPDTYDGAPLYCQEGIPN